MKLIIAVTLGRRLYPVVVSLCCLLAVATSASAEPHKAGDPSPSMGWSYVGRVRSVWAITAFPDKATCEEFKAQGKVRPYAEWKARQDGKKLPALPEYTCTQATIPDTVDPRK